MDRHECIFVSGLCQSRKTQKTLDVIASLTTNARTLLLYITQAGSTLNAFQVIQRLRSHPILMTAFPSVLRAVPTAVSSSIAIVDFYHKKNITAMLKVAASGGFEHVICVIDEADQGALSGFKGRIDVLRQLYSILGPLCWIHSVFVTATVPNLCKMFAHAGNAVPNGVRHLFVTPAESYVSMEWFHLHKRVLIVPGVADLDETAAAKKSIVRNLVLTNLQSFSTIQRRFVLLSFTNSKDEQLQMAKSLVAHDQFDITVCLNSENSKNYTVCYPGGHWAIPFGAMMRAASKGKFSKHVTDKGRVIETGIDTAHDISLSQVLLAGLHTDEDFAEALKCSPAAVRPQLVVMRNFLAEKRPASYPKHRYARTAIIGGNMLSRGITIQDPAIGLTCSGFFFLDGGTGAADAGASHTQKAGRALGNILPFFEGGSCISKPLMVIAAPLFVSALSNERLTFSKGREHDGAIIRVKDYITPSEYKDMVGRVKLEINA